MHCVDLGESFHISIYLHNVASIQPRTSFVKFARSPCTDPQGYHRKVILNVQPANPDDWKMKKTCHHENGKNGIDVTNPHRRIEKESGGKKMAQQS